MNGRYDDDGSIPEMLRLPEGAMRLPDRGASIFVGNLESLLQMPLAPEIRASAVERFRRAATSVLNPSLAVVLGLWIEDCSLAGR